jgi:hypothetical protein
MTRSSRVITRTKVTFEGGEPGHALAIASETTPTVSGTVRFVVERYDPLAGWQFARRITTHTAGGHASASYLPPGPGVYRVKAAYLGTRDAARSISGWVQAEVGRPTSR